MQKSLEGTDKIHEILKGIYGREKGKLAFERIVPLLENFPCEKRKKETSFSEKDMVLITYGDSLVRNGESPLVTFHKFANMFLKDAVSFIHFLPFFPFSW